MKEKHLTAQPGNEVSKATFLQKIEGFIFSKAYSIYHAKKAKEKELEIEQLRKERELKAQSFIEHNQKTIYSKVENYLLEGGSLTVLECWQKFHTTELRMIVSRINKRHGWKIIVSDWVESEGKRFKRYHL